MKFPKLLFFFLLISPFNNLFSSPYDMIPVGDPVLEDILYLSLESKQPFLSFTPPLAPHEIRIFLDSIEISELSPPAQEAYERIKNRLNFNAPIYLSGDNFILSLNVISTLETRVRFNDSISWLPVNSKIPAVLSLPLRFSFADSLQLYVEPMFAVDPEYYKPSGYVAHNVPLELSKTDQNFPLRAYIALGDSWWNFQLGRDRISYGTGKTGNLAISDNPSFYDFARLSFFSDFFKYSFLVSQMPLDIRENNAGADILDRSSSAETTNLDRTNQRFLYVHRIDFTLFDILSISITEGVMAGNSALEIRYLNPLIIFHSLYSFWNYPKWDGGVNYGEEGDDSGDMNGSLFSLEFNWNVVKSFSIYGQFVMNQIATPYKIDKWGAQPNGMGYLAGARYSNSINGWGSVFYLEFIYTDPYLYMNPSPFASLIHMRYLGIAPQRFEYSFIGYQRDTIAAAFGADFFNGDFIYLSGLFTWLLQGKHGIQWNWDNPNAYEEKTPSENAQNSLAASFGARWKFNQRFTLKGAVSAIVTFKNYDNNSGVFGGQAMLSLNFQY